MDGYCRPSTVDEVWRGADGPYVHLYDQADDHFEGRSDIDTRQLFLIALRDPEIRQALREAIREDR